jgi:hypothetical protein
MTETKHTKWKNMLNYQAVVKQMPFFLFLTGLAVLYIYNGHYADRLNRDITKTSKELKELEYEYKTIKGEVLFQSKQSEMVKAVAPLGLKEMTSAPLILEDSTFNN